MTGNESTKAATPNGMYTVCHILVPLLEILTTTIWGHDIATSIESVAVVKIVHLAGECSAKPVDPTGECPVGISNPIPWRRLLHSKRDLRSR